MIKDCNVDYPLPTAMASPISTQANTAVLHVPLFGCLHGTVSARRCRRQQDHCLLPHKGLPSRDHQGREPFLALQRVLRGGRQRGAHKCPDAAFSPMQLGCSVCPAQHFPFGYSNHCSVGWEREEPLLTSLCWTRGQEVGTDRCYGWATSKEVFHLPCMWGPDPLTLLNQTKEVSGSTLAYSKHIAPCQHLWGIYKLSLDTEVTEITFPSLCLPVLKRWCRKEAIYTWRRKVYFLFTLKKPSIDFHLSSNKSLSNAAQNIIYYKGRCSLMRAEISRVFSPFIKRKRGGEKKREELENGMKAYYQ